MRNIIHYKKEGIPTICDNMDELGGHMLTEISQTQNDKYSTIALICGI